MHEAASAITVIRNAARFGWGCPETRALEGVYSKTVRHCRVRGRNPAPGDHCETYCSPSTMAHPTVSHVGSPRWA